MLVCVSYVCQIGYGISNSVQLFDRLAWHCTLNVMCHFIISVLGLGNFGGKRQPNTNNIPLSFPKLKDSLLLDPRCSGWR